MGGCLETRVLGRVEEEELTVLGSPQIAKGFRRMDSRIMESMSLRSRTASRVQTPPDFARTVLASLRRAST